MDVKAGLFYLFETLGQVSTEQCYREALEESVYGEELGFDSVCPAEHHFSEHYGIMPRVELFLAWVAGRTARLRLWPMLIIAPLRDPIQLAEDGALLDNFSGGRFVCSLGTGYRAYEFAPFGQDARENPERLREVAEIVQRLWQEERVSHEGRYYAVRDAACQPRPLQRPMPPLYFTTTRDDQIEWCARRGIAIVPAAGFHPDTIRHDFALHDRIAREAGRPLQVQRPFFKWIYVHEDNQTAVEEGSQYILRTLMAFAHGGEHLFQLLLGKAVAAWGVDTQKPDWFSDRVEAMMSAGITYPNMLASRWTPYVCGDPAHVAEVLQDSLDAGANYFIGGFKCGAMPTEKCRASMALFAREVLPRLKAGR